MKNQTSGRYIFRLAVTLFLITAVMAGLLAAVNSVTKDKIAAARAEKTRLAIAQVLPGVKSYIEYPFTDESGMIVRVYAEDDAVMEPCRFAVEVCPAGFGGGISMLVGVTVRGEVLGISIISHSETAGLGAVAAAKTAAGEAFRGQFGGVTEEVSVTKDGGQIDAITGATITSRGVCEGVNAAIAWLKEGAK